MYFLPWRYRVQPFRRQVNRVHESSHAPFKRNTASPNDAYPTVLEFGNMLVQGKLVQRIS